MGWMWVQWWWVLVLVVERQSAAALGALGGHPRDRHMRPGHFRVLPSIHFILSIC